ncbi:glycosyltransferase family 2 protein [Chelativorans sp. M5D2P16]|uniref:glycosyltransferase family 2 protein n=1 Tax=Chelativorans sp. M5D2P16 TaxID=3095678 RepID=UPI002ACA0423|nr:glycosyltransferase family 2 protein [Chelativorans sp. M5D2P16]MDZ5696475.1 glycosyltransferase family 2 protein [Chelativorans sp. M5D2P16]
MTATTLVSVLVPAFNEEANVRGAYTAIVDTFRALPGHDYEIIFTDNHSTDGTFDILKEICRLDPRVRVIRFSRNIGYQRSLLTAYKAARGDCSVQIDCDLQDPPHLIPEMLALWRQGHQVVYGIRRSLTDNRITALTRRVFYRFINALSEDDLPLNAGEFRLVDRRILDELGRVDDTSPYLRGLISSMGFSQVGFEYDRQARVAGDSKFPLKAMLSLAVDGILNHSLIPLRLASLASLVVGAATFLLLVGYLVGKLLFGQDWPAGFATTTVLLLLSITLNAMFLGIVGEYVGRIFMQSKQRPMVIVEATLNDRTAMANDAASLEARPIQCLDRAVSCEPKASNAAS